METNISLLKTPIESPPRKDTTRYSGPIKKMTHSFVNPVLSGKVFSEKLTSKESETNLQTNSDLISIHSGLSKKSSKRNNLFINIPQSGFSKQENTSTPNEKVRRPRQLRRVKENKDSMLN